ncbi:MAG: hypothetical protein OEL87_03550, partial [Nanoarchaeota archaeon]|nr:hypothetical protein [Nanoarchaeota archaeon]
KSIETASEKSKGLLKFTDGLNMVNQKSIFCHYMEEDKDNIMEYVSKGDRSAIAIPEDAGVIVSDGKIRAVGSGSVFLFEGSGIREV